MDDDHSDAEGQEDAEDASSELNVTGLSLARSGEFPKIDVFLFIEGIWCSMTRGTSTTLLDEKFPCSVLFLASKTECH